MLNILFIMVCFFNSCIADEFAYLFAHGLYNDQSLAAYYESLFKTSQLKDGSLCVTFKSGYCHQWNIETTDTMLWIIQKPFFSFNFPDASRTGFDRSQTSLGQENEIVTLSNAHKKIPHNKIILMGMSRGASTIINFLATRHPTNIAAAILESPFDSIIDTLVTHCGSSWVSYLPRLLYTSPNVIFGKFDPKGIFPINVVNKIDYNLPIFIVASLQDSFIPAFNTATLYLKLRESGHQHVYFLLLNKGVHGYLLEDDDAYLYIDAVHAFYQKYQLPYHPSCAKHGQKILDQCQPSKEQVEQALKNKKSFIYS